MNDFDFGYLSGMVGMIYDILNIDEKYNFEWIEDYFNDDDELELKLDYTGDDIIFKEEDEFETEKEFREYADREGNKIYKKGENLLIKIDKFIKENELDIKCKRMEIDYIDYFIIYIYFSRGK